MSVCNRKSKNLNIKFEIICRPIHFKIHPHMLYTHIHAGVSRNIMTKFNERTNTLLYKKRYTSHTLFERVDVGCVWEVSWRWRQTATYWPKVLLTIGALLSHSSWAAQPWVTEDPSPLSGAGSHSVGILSPTSTAIRTSQAVCGTWLYNCLTSTCFLWVYASVPSSTTGQGDILISSTGCTCFAALPLIYTGASLDWRLGRGSICYTHTHPHTHKHINICFLVM